MYKHLIRPLLFQLSPETIHHIVATGLRIGHYIPLFRNFLSLFLRVRDPRLQREVFGVKFPNPVGLAAGFDKDAQLYSELSAMGFGFVEVGTITPKAQPGNPRTRLFRLPMDGALINRMGFNNKGLENAVNNLRGNAHSKSPVILGGNLGKNTATENEKAPADYLKLFRCLYEHVTYFVINVSCPNVKHLSALQDKENLKQILSGLIQFRRGQNNYRPILLKISPDLTPTQVDDMVEVLIECGIDGVVVANTTTSREGLKSAPELVEAIGNGGLSGAPLTARSLEMVRYIYKKTEGRFPIIGVGGIMSVEDALAMLDAGASLIQVYTGYIYNGPAFVKQICKALLKREQLKKSNAKA